MDLPLRMLLRDGRPANQNTHRRPREDSNHRHVSLKPLTFYPSLANIPLAIRAPRLPPLQSGDFSPDQYFPPSASSNMTPGLGGPRSPHSGSMPPQSPLIPGRGPVPKFQKIHSVQELRPRMNVQPAYRRANPEGGFISVSSRNIYQRPHGVVLTITSPFNRSQLTSRLPIVSATPHSIMSLRGTLDVF